MGMVHDRAVDGVGGWGGGGWGAFTQVSASTWCMQSCEERRRGCGTTHLSLKSQQAHGTCKAPRGGEEQRGVEYRAGHGGLGSTAAAQASARSQTRKGEAGCGRAHAGLGQLVEVLAAKGKPAVQVPAGALRRLRWQQGKQDGKQGGRQDMSRHCSAQQARSGASGPAGRAAAASPHSAGMHAGWGQPGRWCGRAKRGEGASPAPWAQRAGRRPSATTALQPMTRDQAT
jgi:hypothetical protein